MFSCPVAQLWVLRGLPNSRHFQVDEQVTIFLYTHVTKLSIHHVGESFQHFDGKKKHVQSLKGHKVTGGHREWIFPLDTFRIRPFTFLGRPTATIVSAARHFSSKPEDGKQCRVLDKQGHSIELSPSTSTSFTSCSMCYSGTLAVTSWTSTSMLTLPRLSQFLLQDGNARRGMKLTNEGA
jgi:hypothetical protein